MHGRRCHITHPWGTSVLGVVHGEMAWEVGGSAAATASERAGSFNMPRVVATSSFSASLRMHARPHACPRCVHVWMGGQRHQEGHPHPPTHPPRSITLLLLCTEFSIQDRPKGRAMLSCACILAARAVEHARFVVLEPRLVRLDRHRHGLQHNVARARAHTRPSVPPSPPTRAAAQHRPAGANRKRFNGGQEQCVASSTCSGRKRPPHKTCPRTRPEPFNFTPMGVNPISSGSPHVRPMGRTCGEPDEIKKNTHPKNITALFRESSPQPDGSVAHAWSMTAAASWASLFCGTAFQLSSVATSRFSASSQHSPGGSRTMTFEWRSIRRRVYPSAATEVHMGRTK